MSWFKDLIHSKPKDMEFLYFSKVVERLQEKMN